MGRKNERCDIYCKQALMGVEAAAKAAGKDIEVEFINTITLDIGQCRGCGACSKAPDGKIKCIIKDDYLMIEDKILSADGIIIAAPVYSVGIIGQLKNGAVVTHCINLGNVSSDSIAYGGWVGASKPKDQQENPIYGPDAIYTTNAFNENTIAGIGEAESSYVDYCYVIRASDCIDGGTTPFIGHYYTATPKEHNGYIESTTDIIGAAATTVLTNLDFTNAWATVENGVPMPKAVAGYVAAAQSTDYTAANPNPVPDQVTGTTGGGSASDEDDEPSLDDLLNDAANDGNYSKDKTDETTAAPEATTEAKKGCKGAIATGAILVTVSALGLGAVVAKKKED